ncbi:MAG: DUF3142 domain-containing protein [Sphingorhabdus sp.]|uniref:DUF3142 domain-containing protein n=1 Tax=Sphingorhabdus sp. TaxID=1902408 RepID=UPI003CAC7B75
MRLLALLALMFLSACDRAEPGRVDARNYDAFWLWAGVEPQPVLDSAKTIYILAAEIKGWPEGRYVDLRPAVPQVKHAQVWIVYRVETLTWDASVLPRIRRDLESWKGKGNRIAGIQIDFDAATRGLPGYATFLQKLRVDLPPGTGLSVTGLLDWSSGGDSPALNALDGMVDEVVLQTYQGRHTIPSYAAYLRQLERVKLPFKIGLVQHGEWQAPPGLSRNPNFKGYVVFLLNSEL